MSNTEIINKITQGVVAKTNRFISNEDDLAMYASEAPNGEALYMEHLEKWVKDNATPAQLETIKSKGYTVASFASDMLSGIVPEKYENVSDHVDVIVEKIIDEEELTTVQMLETFENDYDSDVDAFLDEYYYSGAFASVFGDLLTNGTIKATVLPQYTLQEYIDDLE